MMKFSLLAGAFLTPRRDNRFLAPETAPNCPVGDAVWFEELAARKPPPGHPFAEPPKGPSRWEGPVQTTFFLVSIAVFVWKVGRWEITRTVLTPFVSW